MLKKEQNIGSLVLKDKFIMAPVKTGYGNLKGEVSAQHIWYYQRRAEGGVAMIIAEPFFIHPSGKELPTQIGVHDDAMIPGLKSLVDGVHEKGAKICAHINHAGRAANPKLAGEMLMAPSPVPCPAHGKTPKEMTENEIEQAINWFAQAARRAVTAGFDAIEMQFGLGYLAHQFFSPRTNNREDKWGNRLRFSSEMIQAVRKEIGWVFPVIARLSVTEFSDGGTSEQDAIALVKMLEENGVDAFHAVNGSACDSPPVYYQFFTLPENQNQESAQHIRQVVTKPVITTGRNGNPEQIRQLLVSETVDFIGMGRPLVADPDLPNKMIAGEDGSITRCGYCLQGCLLNVKALNGLKCVVNPEVGEKVEQRLTPASRAKKVAVIGGGPAGIKAAITADARGHQVHLFEKEDHLGGQFALSFLAPAKSGMKILHEDLMHHLKKSSVHVHLNEEINSEKLAEINPDQIILATGAQPKIISFKGLESRDYFNGFNIYEFENWYSIRKAVVIGGGLIGMEAAEFIAENKVETTVLEILPQVAGDMEMISRKLLMKRVSALPVTIYTEAQVQEIKDQRIDFLHKSSSQHLDDVDILVIATGTESVNELEEPLRTAGFEVIIAGDMKQPAKIYEAIHSGFAAGLAV